MYCVLYRKLCTVYCTEKFCYKLLPVSESDLYPLIHQLGLEPRVKLMLKTILIKQIKHFLVLQLPSSGTYL